MIIPAALSSTSLATSDIKAERKPSGDLSDLLEVFSPAMDSAMDSAMDLDSAGIIPGLDDAHDHKVLNSLSLFFFFFYNYFLLPCVNYVLSRSQHPLDLLPAVGSHSSVLATVTTTGGEVLLPPPLPSSTSSQQNSRKRGRSKAG